MIFLDQYISKFFSDPDPVIQDLGEHLAHTKQAYSIFNGGNPITAFQSFVDQYNWLGDQENKKKHKISENLARNLPGALMCYNLALPKMLI
jgi:hypothetical protein